MHTFYEKCVVKAELANPIEVNVNVKNKLDAIALGFDFSF
jgi:hypothetical protein